MIIVGFVASLLAGLATVVGALPILMMGRPSEAQHRLLMGFAAGVMLAASLFSLILPGIVQAEAQGRTLPSAMAIVFCAVLLGSFTLAQIDAIIPPLDQLGLGPAGIAGVGFRRAWLFVAAITLHNFPEGMAVGVSFGAGDISAGIVTAAGIGIQNMPEGLAVAAALASLGFSARMSVGAAFLSGLVEPVAGLFGAAIISVSLPLLPWALGFAAGAMVYVVLSEILPARGSIIQGKQGHAGLLAGLATMVFLDTTLG